MIAKHISLVFLLPIALTFGQVPSPTPTLSGDNMWDGTQYFHGQSRGYRTSNFDASGNVIAGYNFATNDGTRMSHSGAGHRWDYHTKTAVKTSQPATVKPDQIDRIRTGLQNALDFAQAC